MTLLDEFKSKWNPRTSLDYIEVPMIVAVKVFEFIEAYDQWVNSHPGILGETCIKCLEGESEGNVITHGERCQELRAKI